MNNDYHSILTVLWLGMMGLLVGVAQMLVHPSQDMTWRYMIGRALSSGAMGVAAGSVLIWHSGLPLEAVTGLAAALASIGTSGLERITKSALERYKNGD